MSTSVSHIVIWQIFCQLGKVILQKDKKLPKNLGCLCRQHDANGDRRTQFRWHYVMVQKWNCQLYTCLTDLSTAEKTGQKSIRHTLLLIGSNRGIDCILHRRFPRPPASTQKNYRFSWRHLTLANVNQLAFFNVCAQRENEW